MTDVLRVYRRIIEQAVPAFNSTRTWHSNGERGHLHGGSNCSKLDRKRASTMHTLSLRAAFDRKVCVDCIQYGPWDEVQRAVIHAAHALESAEQTLRNPYADHRRVDSTGPLAGVRSRALLERLRNEVLERGQAPGLSAWSSRVLEEIDEATPDSPDETTLQSESLRLSALSLIQQRISRDRVPVSFWGDPASSGLLGPQATGHNAPLGRFARTWVSRLWSGVSPGQVAHEVINDKQAFDEVISEPDRHAMALCSTTTPMEGENVWAYAQRRWRELCTEAITGAEVGMTAYLGTLTEPAAYVLLANRQQNGASLRRQATSSDSQRLVGAAQRSYSHGDRSVLYCHPTVATYLTGDRERDSSYGEWSHPVTVSELPSDEILETALALWDPYSREGSYVEFERALDAAKVL